MSVNPAKVGGYVDQGQPLAIGNAAHITLVDTSYESVVDASVFASKSSNSPFHGERLSGKVQVTLFHGVPVFRDGVLTGSRYSA